MHDEPDKPLKSLCLDGKPLRNVYSGKAEVTEGNKRAPLSAFKPTGLSHSFPAHFFKVYSSSGIGHQTSQGNQREKLANVCLVVPIFVAQGRQCVSFLVAPGTDYLESNSSSPAQITTEPNIDTGTTGQINEELQVEAEHSEQATSEPNGYTDIEVTPDPNVATETVTGDTVIFAADVEVLPLGSNNSFPKVIIACNGTRMLVNGALPIGGVVVDVVNTNQSINAERCSDKGRCGGVFQTVISQERAASLNGIPCPSGEECYLVITKRATISDLFSQEIVSRAQEAGLNGSVELGGSLLIACDENTNTREGSSSVDVSVRQGTRPAALPDSILRSMFDECNGGGGEMYWKKLLGHCPFSDVCDNKPDKSCYHCTQNGGSCNNGCGPAWFPFTVSSVRPIWGTWDFGNACCGHDYCWDSMAFGKDACDMAFRRSMHRYCRKEWPNFWLNRVHCQGMAEMFYLLVHKGGDSAFAESQRNQKAHLESCKESPSPEPKEDDNGAEASVYTDPHLVSFDGVRFDAQASGEFLLVRQPSSGLRIHGRFSGPETSGSVLTAIAMEETGSEKLQLEVVSIIKRLQLQ